jgi:ATP-dependent exoDNAse (exonuclease V) beta subunit
VQEKYHTLTLPDFVRVALNMSHWYGSLNGDPRREQALANIDKLIDQIAEQCRIPGQTIHDVLVSIEDVPWADREPQSMYNLDANAVQIMTIHSAKGLEFPIVILCDLNSKGGWDSIIVTERYGITSALDKSPDELHGAASKVVVPSPSHLLNKHLSSQRSTAEDKRLLYVGATRAEQLLLISLVRKTTKSEELAATHGITDLLRPIYLDSEPTEEQLPSTVSMFTYHVSARKTDHEDLSGLSPWMRTTRALSVTQLLPDHFNAGQTQDEDAAVLGDVIHEVIAEFLSNLGERPVTHDEIVDACRRHSHALGPNALNDAVSQVARALSLDLWSKADLLHCEKLLGAMLGPTLLTGRLDLLLIKGSKARIVDWKTSRISSDELLEHAHFYDIQMKGYAWLVLTTLGIAEVETTLVFTDLIGRSKDYRVDRSYSKTSLPSLGSELQDAVTLRLHTVAST